MHLIKYTKKYLPMILLSIGLLFAQANFDLALPDYLSDIVNVGIQQGGIENPTPEIIREQELSRILMFMTEENQSKVLDSYDLISPTDSEYTDLADIYTNLNNMDNVSVYLLRDLSDEEIINLNGIISAPLLTVFVLEQITEKNTSTDESTTDGPDATSSIGINMSMIPPGMDLFTYLSHAPEETRLQLVEDIRAQFGALGENMIEAVAIRAVQAEYETLGLDMKALQTNYILKIGGIMLLLTILSMLCAISVAYMAAKTATGIARDMRRDVFEKVEQFSLQEFDTFNTSSLITRSTNDITQIQSVTFMIIRIVFYAPIMGIGGIIRAINKASSLWWLIAVAVITLLVMIFTVFLLALPKFKWMQKLVDSLNRVAREHLSGLMVIRAFNREEFVEKRFEDVNVELTRTTRFVNRVLAVLFPVMMLIMNGLIIGILWIGAKQVGDGYIQIGDLMAFMQYGMQIVMAFLMMSIMFIYLPRASVSANRISQVLATEPAIVDDQDPIHFDKKFNGEIEFKNVHFKYPGAESEVLSNISFVAKPGQTTAIIGPTGSGKTTLVNLIPRLYDITNGEILVDGKDIRKVPQKELREKIGYIPQKSGLFSGSIRSNLKYANENATEEDMKKAIEVAQAADFVFKRPEGLRTRVGQGGMDLSGGQKQRLSIARALVKNPPIYIFDDSFSALDFKTDAKLRKELKQYTKNSTILIVSQRVATIMDADQILVIQDGKLVGKGTHEQLMKECKVYQEIALSQNTLEELS